MAVALVSATGVLLWKRWNWLAVAAFVTSAPQLVAWLADEYDARLVARARRARRVLGPLRRRSRGVRAPRPDREAPLLVGEPRARGRDPRRRRRLADARPHGSRRCATAWVVGVAVVHVALGAATFRGRVSREISLLLLAVGIGLSAIAPRWRSTAPRSSPPGRSRPCSWHGSLRGSAARVGTSRPPGCSRSRRAHTLAFDAPLWDAGDSPSLQASVARCARDRRRRDGRVSVSGAHRAVPRRGWRLRARRPRLPRAGCSRRRRRRSRLGGNRRRARRCPRREALRAARRSRRSRSSRSLPPTRC